MFFSPKLNLALRVAAYAYAPNFRKAAPVPYVAHPMAVALLAMSYLSNHRSHDGANVVTPGDREIIFIACLLHDVLEDVPAYRYSAEDMERDFGPSVLQIVRDLSEPAVDLTKVSSISRAWQIRKDGYISHLTSIKDWRTLLVVACDKIHNLSEINVSLTSDQASLEKLFSVSFSKECWFYQTVFNLLKDKSLPSDAILDYQRELDKLKQFNFD